MARPLNTLGNRANGTITPLAQDRSGEIIIDLSQPDVLVPDDVTSKLPSPYCHGAILNGMAGPDRVMVHFPTAPKYRSAALVGLKLIDRIANEAFENAEDQSVYTLKVKGDFARLRYIGSKDLIFSAHEVEIISKHSAGHSPVCS